MTKQGEILTNIICKCRKGSMDDKQYKITKNGVALDPKLYTIDEVNRTFISKEDGLTIDFAGENGWIFRIKYSCTISAGDGCFISAYSNCTITVGNRCIIDAWGGCNITTGENAVVVTSENSTITGGKNCVVIRRYTNEVIKLVERQTIRLNDYMTGGYTVVEPIETIEIEGKKYNKEEVEELLKTIKQII